MRTLITLPILLAACAVDPYVAALPDTVQDPVVADIPADETDQVVQDELPPTEADTLDADDILEEDDLTGDTDTEPLLAEADLDTFADPLDDYRFTPYAARAVDFTDDVSFPAGDPEDWFGFRTIASENHVTRVTLTLLCLGTDTTGLVAKIWEDGNSPVPTNHQLNCAQGTRDFSLDSNGDYLVQVSFPHGSEEVYVAYDLTVEN